MCPRESSWLTLTRVADKDQNEVVPTISKNSGINENQKEDS